MVLWNITVTDISTNRGVANAKVCLIAGGGALCWPPEQANYTKYTNANGLAAFEVPAAFYRVGVLASGYESAHDPHNPPAGCEWWTCTGAGGAGYDYNFAVRPGEAPPPEASGKIVSIRVQDIDRQEWFNYDNGVWDRAPKVTVGANLYIAAWAINEGDTFGTLTLQIKDDVGATLATKSPGVGPGVGFGVETGTIDMPNRQYGILITVTPSYMQQTILKFDPWGIPIRTSEAELYRRAVLRQKARPWNIKIGIR